VNRVAKIPSPLLAAEMSTVALQDRVKVLEMQVSEHRHELDSLQVRVLRAEQKIVKLKVKAKSKKKRGELWPGLDHIANFIIALDTQGMSPKQVRSAIYTECTTPTKGEYEDD